MMSVQEKCGIGGLYYGRTINSSPFPVTSWELRMMGYPTNPWSHMGVEDIGSAINDDCCDVLRTGTSWSPQWIPIPPVSIQEAHMFATGLGFYSWLITAP